MLVRVVGATLGLVAGVLAALVVVVLGPRNDVTCGSSTGPAAVAEEAFQGMGSGHVDGPTRNTCPVPSAASWILAGGAVIAGVAGGLVATGRRHPAGA